MARCPSCQKHFATLEDEAHDHACPFCGYGDAPVHREHLDGEEIRCEGRFIGCVQRQPNGTYAADAWLDWGNLTLSNAPTREYAVGALIAHARKQQRLEALDTATQGRS